jgi:hypothetical protein
VYSSSCHELQPPVAFLEATVCVEESDKGGNAPTFGSADVTRRRRDDVLTEGLYRGPAGRRCSASGGAPINRLQGREMVERMVRTFATDDYDRVCDDRQPDLPAVRGS